MTQIYLDVFPDIAGSFTYYDDDGETYAYEKGIYYQQHLSVNVSGSADHPTIRFTASAPAGLFKPALRSYLIALHHMNATSVLMNGVSDRQSPDLPALERSSTAGWSVGRDRFGSVTYLKIPAQTETTVAAR